MSRFLFVSAASAMLSLGGLFAQSAPAPSPKPASDMARFERVAAELRRAGDEKLAAEVMEAARKIAADKAADKGTDKPAATARAGRRQPAGEGVPVTVEVPLLGDFVAKPVPATAPVEVRAARALEPLTGLLGVGRESTPLTFRRVAAPSVVPPVAEAPTPSQPTAAGVARSRALARPVPAPAATPDPNAAPPHEYTHRHEVHHYFHGAPPSGAVPGFGGTVAPPSPPSPGQAPSARGGFRAVAPMSPFSTRSPRDPRTPAAPTPPDKPSLFGGQGTRRVLADLATPDPVAPAPAQVRTTRPRSSSPTRAGGVSTPAPRQANTTPPDAAPARRARVAPAEDRLESEVDGLRREVEELRELLQKLRSQVKQRKPD